ncbi:plasmid pRiA4b ORF-3 family protein [Salibacterium lacus]|uniref:Plasmid pRiA4b ORF-3 family protein n=1 Tax=Salibacterium lacus TaxID=1898109 RepID=A0ABW5T647_9BACI
MLIQCTKALREEMEIKDEDLAAADKPRDRSDLLTGWHANVIMIGDRPAVLLMNDESRYPIVIGEVEDEDFSEMPDLMAEAIREVLRMEGVREDVLERYMSEGGGLVISKASDQRWIGKMNRAAVDVEFEGSYIEENRKIQRPLSMKAARMIQSEGEQDAFFPAERMVECLGRMYDTAEVLDVELYQLHIELPLKKHNVWRRVYVPATFTFEHLHQVIQVVFEWKDSHLHQFFAGRNGQEPMTIVMDGALDMLDVMDTGKSEVRLEHITPLKDILPDYTDITYQYDFGDDWQHTITFEKTLSAVARRAVYVEGHGDSPPEDIEAERGLESYVMALIKEQEPDAAYTFLNERLRKIPTAYTLALL